MNILLRKIKSLFVRIGIAIKKCFASVGRARSLAFAKKQCRAALREKQPSLPPPDWKAQFDVFLPDRGRSETEFGFLEPPSVDLSVIVAAYNVEPYVKECIHSVLRQETKYNMEVIVVNDGSTDGTKEQLAAELTDPRLRYYEQANAGQAAARNFAILHSRGRYLMVLDADDLLTPGSIDFLMDLAAKTQSEIVEGAILRFHGNFASPEQKRVKTKTLEGAAKDNYILTSYGYSVAKIYRRELWENVRYPVGYIFEDVISKFVLRRLAKRITVTDRLVYGYRWNPNSSSHGKLEKKALDSILVFPHIAQSCVQNGVSNDRVFYLLALNHIGVLNHYTTAPFAEKERNLCFWALREQLMAIQNCKKGKLPFWFSLLEKAILTGNFTGWNLVANTIRQYNRAAKYREIN